MKQNNKKAVVKTIAAIAVFAMTVMLLLPALSVITFAADRDSRSMPDGGYSVGNGTNGNNNSFAGNGGGVTTDTGHYTGNTTDRYNGRRDAATDNGNDTTHSGISDNDNGNDTNNSGSIIGGGNDTNNSGIVGDVETTGGTAGTTNNNGNVTGDVTGEEEGEVLGAVDEDNGVVGIIIAILIAVAVIVLIIALVPKGTSGA